MRSLMGLLLLAAGVVVGAHAYYPDTVEQHIHIGKVARILAPASGDHGVVGVPQPQPARSFSPENGFLTTGSVEAGQSVATVETGSPILASEPTLVRSNATGAAIVRGPAGDSDYSRSLANGGLTASARWKLVHDLQTELRRVGCYGGRIDGSWGPGSQYAVRDFLQRVNSALPSEDPDHIMLSLLRSHQGLVCGKPCQDGFTKSAQGRCLPYAISVENKVAPAEADVTPPPTARLVRSGVEPYPVRVATPALQPSSRPPLDGRMAVGGPLPADVAATETAPGYSTVPPLTREAVPPPSYTPPKKIKASKTRKAANKRETTSRASRHSSQARKRARHKALIRQAFGDGFD